MSLDKLLKQIRSIIREEIEYALDKKLNESKKKDDRTILNHGMSLMKEVGVPKKQTQFQTTKKPMKSGLNSIQDILNETRMSMEAAMNEDEYPEMRFTTDSIVGTNGISGIPAGVDPSELTPEVSKALTRDYSALMAKINEKKGR